MMQHFLTISNISKSFGSFQALKQINLEIKQGEFICLLGPSGCGKTTLLRILAGLETPDDGKIRIQDNDITSLPPAKRNFGVVFQSYALFPNLTAHDNIAYGLAGKGMDKKEIRYQVAQMLELVGLSQIGERYPSQLSGGQQQRVALARALALSPQFLLLDEPLSALDAKVRTHLREQICELQERLGITTIMVTHDQEEAITMADRIVVMNHAEVIQVGTPEEIYESPATPFVAGFIGTTNFIKRVVNEAALQWGDIWQAIRPEHIQIVTETNGEHIRVKLNYIEFQGANYRITVETLRHEHGIYAGQLLKLDISAQKFRQMKLSKGDHLSIAFTRNPENFDQELPMEGFQSGRLEEAIMK